MLQQEVEDAINRTQEQSELFWQRVNKQATQFSIGDELHYWDNVEKNPYTTFKFWRRTCNKCYQRGHLQSKCPLLMTGNRKDGRFCSYCTETGHFARFCEKRLKMLDYMFENGWVKERINSEDVNILNINTHGHKYEPLPKDDPNYQTVFEFYDDLQPTREKLDQEIDNYQRQGQGSMYKARIESEKDTEQNAAKPAEQGEPLCIMISDDEEKTQPCQKATKRKANTEDKSTKRQRGDATATVTSGALALEAMQQQQEQSRASASQANISEHLHNLRYPKPTDTQQIPHLDLDSQLQLLSEKIVTIEGAQLNLCKRMEEHMTSINNLFKAVIFDVNHNQQNILSHIDEATNKIIEEMQYSPQSSDDDIIEEEKESGDEGDEEKKIQQ